MTEYSFPHRIFTAFLFLFIVSQCWSQAIPRLSSQTDSLHLLAQKHFEVGEQWFQNEDYANALTEFQKAAELGIENYKAYERLVDAYLKLKLDKEAQLYVDSLLTQKSKAPFWVFAKGYLVYSKENFNEALELFRESVVLKPDFAKSLLLIGFAEYRVGNLKDGLAAAERALKLFKQTNDITSLGHAYRWAGYLMGKLGRKTEGIRNLEKAKVMFQESGDALNESKCLNLLGILYKDSDLYNKAILCYEESLKQSRLIKNKRVQASILANLGTLYLRIGDYSKALNYSYTALPLLKEIQFLSAFAGVYNNIGIIQRSLNDYEQALRYVNKSLELNRKRNYKFGLYQNYQTLGIIYRNQGDFDRAFELFDKALSLSVESGDENRRASILRTIGNAYKRQHMFDHALKYLHKAYDIFKQTENKMQRCYTLNDIAQIQSYKRNFAEAEQSIKDGLQVAEQHKLTLAKYHLYDTYGYLLNSKAQYARAKEVSLVALGLLESFYYKTPVGSATSFFLDNKINTYDVMINSLINLNEVGEAFRCSQKFKVQGLLNFLNKENPLLSENVPDELYINFTNIEKQIVETNIDLSHAYSKPSTDKSEANLDSLKQSLQLLKDQFQARLDEIQIFNSNYAKIENHLQEFHLNELQNLLKKDDALIEYFVGDENLYIWIVKRGALACEVVPLKRDDLINKVQRLRQPFTDLKSGKIKSLTEMNYDVNLAQELYQMVFQPVEKHLNASVKKLIIVPHHILYYLPFSGLVSKVADEPNAGGALFSEYKNAHFLLEKYAISYVQSANLLNPELWKRKQAREFDSQLLAFGNPDFKSSLEQVQDTKTNNDGGFDLFSLLFRSSNGWIFEPLPKSEQEVRNISGIFKSNTTFTGSEATEDNFKTKASHYKMLHLATHAIVDENQPLYSRIVFAQDDDPTEDGFLQTYEIFDLDLDADLVTLSACETGLGKLSKSEGFVGLTRAFMYAGAKSLLVSLWSVDESTSVLMQEFYRNLSNGESKTEALRKAKLNTMGKVIKTENGMKVSLSHPFYWAPFVLFGNYN